MSGAVVAYVGIGSNVDGPEERVKRAAAVLDRLPKTRLSKLSPLYLNPPMGPAEQPHYVNAVAALRTELEPRALLDLLHEIEAANGRIRQQHWGPRTLDLDLLLHGDVVSDDPDLILPHPGLADRAFVLVPLADIAPDLQVVGLGTVSELKSALPADAVESLLIIS